MHKLIINTIISLSLLDCPVTSFTIIRTHHKKVSSVLNAAGDLPTALEWLAEENDWDIHWMDPGAPTTTSTEKDIKPSQKEDMNVIASSPPERMPLYPLEACYLPVLEDEKELKDDEYSFIRSIEPRNLKMAMDMKQETFSEVDDGVGVARFCAVLKANDTGRIATIGTIMRVVEFDEQYLWDGKTLSRVILKCIPEKAVEILNIVNPDAWSSESRLLRSEEYLIADVQPFMSPHDSYSLSEAENDLKQILHDYETVKEAYKSDESSSFDFPQFAFESLSKLPDMPVIKDEKSFFIACNIWQKLCYTIKEAKRVNLQSEVNEITISAAMEMGGPLNLPVHREDLPFDVRIGLDEKESDAARDFIKLGMDPCLQFQHLLSTSKLQKKVNILKGMIAKESRRLQNSINVERLK